MPVKHSTYSLRLQPTAMVAKVQPSNPMEIFTFRLSPRMVAWLDSRHEPEESEESRAAVIRNLIVPERPVIRCSIFISKPRQGE